MGVIKQRCIYVQNIFANWFPPLLHGKVKLADIPHVLFWMFIFIVSNFFQVPKSLSPAIYAGNLNALSIVPTYNWSRCRHPWYRQALISNSLYWQEKNEVKFQIPSNSSQQEIQPLFWDKPPKVRSFSLSPFKGTSADQPLYACPSFLSLSYFLPSLPLPSFLSPLSCSIFLVYKKYMQKLLRAMNPLGKIWYFVLDTFHSMCYYYSSDIHGPLRHRFTQ